MESAFFSPKELPLRDPDRRPRQSEGSRSGDLSLDTIRHQTSTNVYAILRNCCALLRHTRVQDISRGKHVENGGLQVQGIMVLHARGIVVPSCARHNRSLLQVQQRMNWRIVPMGGVVFPLANSDAFVQQNMLFRIHTRIV